jgi:release factor glutamine methyltransferase
MTSLSIAQALAAAQTLGLDRLDAQLLLIHALGKPDSDRAWLLAHDSDLLTEQTLDAFRSLTLRRAAGEPLAYIVGYKEFFGLRFDVDARVLVPRPDTETLVQWTLDVLQAVKDAEVLDLGTGSGAVAIAIAHSLKCQVTATDVSQDALAVASHNARQLCVDVRLIHSSWLEKVSGHYHAIASNPPYIANADPHLAALAHEPLNALTAGVDGMEDIRQIIRNAPDHLHPGGWLLLEHGYDQAARVCELLAQRGFAQVQSRDDLAGIARCSGGRWDNPTIDF